MSCRIEFSLFFSLSEKGLKCARTKFSGMYNEAIIEPD